MRDKSREPTTPEATAYKPAALCRWRWSEP